MKTFKVWSFVLGCLCTLFVWYLVETNRKEPKEPQREDHFISIEESIDDEYIENDDNIFFIETRIANFHNLDSHQACSIESAALAYPNTRIFVMFLTKTNVVRLNHSSLIDVINSYENVHLRLMNLFEYAKDTPLESWIRSDKLASSKYQISHTSDVLRFLTLWKFGGTYLDLDVIVMKNTSLNNYACMEDDTIVNGAILNLDKRSGKKIASLLMNDIIDNFDGSKWAHNGPEVLTRVLKKVCKVDRSKLTDNCENFNLLAYDKCYSIGWREWKKFFKEVYADEVKTKTRDSNFVHLWNKYSSNYQVRLESKTAIISLAESFCPKVLYSRGEFF